MPAAPLPEDEEERLKTLQSYEILDTFPEQFFDDLTLLASQICQTPIALVSLVDRHRQWFKSRIGLEAEETPRDLAFCAHAILDQKPLIVNSALEDPRFASNPLVVSDPKIRFYAGIPLEVPEGKRLGTLCILDQKPRELSPVQIQALLALSRQVVSQMVLRRKQIELKAATHIANEANEAKSSFLASMSHELRTPMNAIIGFSNILVKSMQDPGDATKLKYINRIRVNGLCLVELINNILDLSKIEAKLMGLHKSSFEFVELIEEIQSRIETLFIEKENYFTISISKDLPRINTDRAKLGQCIINLLSNASKFTQNGSITVSAAPFVKDDQTWLRLEVIDTGIGISEEEQEKVFEAFTQAEGNLQNYVQGTGLGLTITREFCHLMGGGISAKSKAGEGTTFSIEIPIG